MSRPLIVSMARRSFAMAHIDERFPGKVVQPGQLLLANDPVVEATAAGEHWVAVGTADEATAGAISALGPQARYEAFVSKLGPLPLPDGEPSPEHDAASKRRRGRPKGRRVTKAAIVAKFRALREANEGRRPTQQELADNLPEPVGLRTLSDYLTEYGLPWPIE